MMIGMLKLLLVTAAATVAAHAQNPLTDAVMARYKGIRLNLVESAEAMPADAYSFKLTPVQRTFAEWVGHVTIGNYNFCATIKGEKAPDAGHLHSMTDKAGLTAALKKSFDYCDGALAGMTDAKALKAVSVGSKEVYPVQGMVSLVSSDNEHYGNMVGYMRSKGVTPPSTARAKK
jgi:hypothetical protein